MIQKDRLTKGRALLIALLFPQNRKPVRPQLVEAVRSDHCPLSFPPPCYVFRSFECASITLKLLNTILTKFSIYRPPTCSSYSNSILLLARIHNLTLHRCHYSSWILDHGDFNIHVDKPFDSVASEFLTLFSSTDLVQPANFWTHCYKLTFDLIIASSL